ncbi:MAG: fructosamine kinase family protein [Gammaproteobacteria bacterium]|nr:fructosamine kinase family protein [Gammaproteobacteria bacterium]
MIDWKLIEQLLSKHSGRTFHIVERQVISGGSINNARRVSDGRESFFVKINRAPLAHMFAAESAALEELHNTGAIRVPEPISHGVSGQECYFVMRWLDLSGSPDAQEFGRRMAALHRHTHQQFGFHLDNTIGSTPQLNNWSDNWIDFWQKQRLGYQLKLAKQNGFGDRLYALGLQLNEKTPLFFASYTPVPSLLHGDLWSGNWGATGKGQPVIFDPACYYGDREADLAMMELFGHPGKRFFDAYHESFALDPGYALRKKFYNLYHVLNHANLFGSSYAMQAENMIESLLVELG